MGQLNTIEWNLSFGTPPFRRHKIYSQKNVPIIFVFVTSIERTPPFRGKGHFFWVPKPGFYLHSGNTLETKSTSEVTDHKNGRQV